MRAKLLVGLLLEPVPMGQVVTGNLFLADPVWASELTGTDTCPEDPAAPWPALTGVDTDHWAPGVWASPVRSTLVLALREQTFRVLCRDSPLRPRDAVCRSHGNGKRPHCREGADKQALGRSSCGILFRCGNKPDRPVSVSVTRTVQDGLCTRMAQV